MSAYYSENDPYAAAWLRNLIAAGHIAPGDVDDRSIKDVKADDLRGYTQCHFFAGVAGWSIALRLAGWPDDRPVWTGSCPCQPFSAAGAGKAADDERHLWPSWFSFIAECGPAIVFGEQVEAAIGWGWLDAVFADMEGEGYACGATVLPACGVGAPHIRQRCWFVADAGSGGVRRSVEHGSNIGAPQEISGEVREQRFRLNACTDDGLGKLADADGRNASTEGLQRGGQHGQRAQDGGAHSLANSDSTRRGSRRASEARDGRDTPRLESSGLCDAGELGNASSSRLSPRQQPDLQGARRGQEGRAVEQPSGSLGFWSAVEWLPCTDGKARPTQSRLFPLAHGVQSRTSKLRAYGNAIVPQVAAEFIAAFMECEALAERRAA